MPAIPPRRPLYRSRQRLSPEQELAMSDDTSEEGMQHRTRINASQDDYERYWSEQFAYLGIS